MSNAGDEYGDKNERQDLADTMALIAAKERIAERYGLKSEDEEMKELRERLARMVGAVESCSWAPPAQCPPNRNRPPAGY